MNSAAESDPSVRPEDRGPVSRWCARERNKSPVLVRLVRRWRQRRFAGSAVYWRARYDLGGNSGAGSYGRLAEYKAEFLNGFVRDQGIRSIIEFGCGDGNQLALAKYPNYIGLDVAQTAIDVCLSRFLQDESKSFYLYDTARFVDNAHVFTGELALSLDVVYHLVEDRIFELYMRHLFASATRYVIIYSSNFVSSGFAPHVRHRKFTDWVEENIVGWMLAKVERNPFANESWADFFVFCRQA